MAIHLQVYRPNHPNASSSKMIYAHVEITERALGRLLPEGAEIHHVDGNPRNNVNRNLVICQDKAYHKLLHVRAKVVKAGGNPNTDKLCCDCRRPKHFADFCVMRSNLSTGRQPACRDCARVRRTARTKAAQEARVA